MLYVTLRVTVVNSTIEKLRPIRGSARLDCAKACVEACVETCVEACAHAGGSHCCESVGGGLSHLHTSQDPRIAAVTVSESARLL